YSDATCSTLIQSGVATGTSINLTTAALTEGSYTFYANSTDTAGNSSACSSASVSYDLDITPPAAPSGLSLIDPAGSPGNETTPTFEITGVTIGDTIAIYTDIACTVLKGSKVATAGTDYIVSSTLTEGSYTFYVNSTDPVGNVSGCSSGTAYILDVTSPVAPSGLILIDPATSPGNDKTPEILVNGVIDGNTVYLHTNSTCTATIQSGLSSSATISITTNELADGDYIIYANTIDPASNLSACSSTGVDYSVDTTVPNTPTSLSLIDPATSPSNDTTPTFEITGITTGDTVAIYTDSACTILKGSTVAIGATDYITSSELTIETTYSFYANSTDMAGNISGCSVTSAEYILDLAKSVADTEISISALSSIFESATGTQTILITLSATSANTVTATLQAAGTATEGTDYTLTNIGITIPIGSISTSANFTIVDDALDEPDETVLFSLKGLTNAKTGASSTMTITIVDEDAAPTVSFSSASQLVAELDTVVTATMVLSAASAFDVDVFWEVTGTASDSSVDHDATDGSVTILAGATSATTSFNIYDDALIESTETVILTVTPRLATNASPGGTPAHTVTISATEAVVVDIVKGIGHSCALIDTGKIRCWGLNSHGQLGYGNVNNIGDDEFPSSAGDVNVGFTATQIAAGNYHSCALSTTGTVRCWGRNNFGQLGYANTIDIGDDELPSIAGHVTVGGSVSRIFADGNRTCAKLNTDELRCWGSGIYGSLGYGYEDMIGDVSIGATAVKVQTCGDSTCIISDDSRVKCWGYGSDGGNGQKNTDHISDDETPDTIGFIPI
ncbi:MAG: hypothetical protein KAQ98_08050, partial [Bacteriovoracaceae bacterium]|nr:hypothetical protein [Bacteriovoracaceae bacterium]